MINCEASMDKMTFLKKLKKTETDRWKLPHTLMIDERVNMEMRGKIEEHFQSPLLHLCHTQVNRNGFSYKRWLVKDSKSNWVINFNEESDGTYLVKVHECEESLTVYKELPRKDDILDRMKFVVGATNYSMLLRNSEHVAWYILTSVWVSFQICQEFSHLKDILNPDIVAEKLVLKRPQELLHGNKEIREVFNDSSYDKECVQNVVENEILDKSNDPFRVLVIGPTGVGKSTIINHLYNREVCTIGKDSATRQTDEVSSTHGFYFYGKKKKDFKRVNIFDTIGLCDGQLSDSENIEYIRSYFEPRIEKLDKVVVIFSVESKSENNTEALKACLYALNYADNKENFIFVLSQCDLYDQDIKESEEQLYKMVNKITFGNMPPSATMKEQTMISSNLDQQTLSEDLKRTLRDLRTMIFSDVREKLFIPRRKELEKELNVWKKKKHTLENVPDVTQNQHIRSLLHLCYTENVFAGGHVYKVYFLTDKKMSIKFKFGKVNKMQISKEMKAENEYHIEIRNIFKSRAVEERISHVMGFSNFSLAFRNTEHVCRYIISGVWVSYQMTRGGVLRTIFENHLTDEFSMRKFINVLPSSLNSKQHVSTMRTIYEEDEPEYFISYESKENYLKKKGDDSWYNIVFVGASGAGKLPLINHLFNQEVLPPKKPLIRNCQYICGSYQKRKVCVVDTIGLNGEDIDPDQILKIDIDSLKSNLTHIDKLVIIASRRIELEQGKSIRNFLSELNFEENPENSVFIYNNSSSSVDPERRESNILYFLKEIGMNHKKRGKKDLSLTLTTDLTYEEAKPQLETYRAAILDDDSKSVDLVDKKVSEGQKTTDDTVVEHVSQDNEPENRKQKLKTVSPLGCKTSLLALALLVAISAVFVKSQWELSKGEGAIYVHYEKGLTKLWGEATLDQVRDYVRRGDIKVQHIKAMAARMDVRGVFQANVYKSDLVDTFEIMLEEWFNEELFEISPTEAQVKLVSFLRDSKCSKKVVAHIQKLCDSYQ